MRKMVCVVGAGPSGLTVAKELQEKGWDSVVLEEHPVVGNPVACTGLISKSGVKDLGINKVLDEVLVNKIRRAQIFSPNHELLEVKRSETVAYVIDRGEFDRVLAKSAEDVGVEVRLNTRAIDVRNETVFVQHKGRGELIKAKVVVGADGVNSKMRSILGIKTSISDYVHAFQVVAKGDFEPNTIQVFFGDYAKNFFAWVVPENEERARVGLASTSKNIRKDFNVFVHEKNISGEFCDRCSSLIPIGPPLKGIVRDNLLLVGDAAFQTKATTGGGIILGMNAAKIAANSIDEYFKNGVALSSYERNCESLNKELRLHWKIRQYINGLNEDRIDSLFRKMNKARVGEFLSEFGDMDRPSRFLGKIFTKPSMWRFFPEALRFLRA